MIAPPLHLLQRHPMTIRAHFEFSLVLTYAFPQAALAEMLPPGLAVDAHDGMGFVAIALVQTNHLRPAFMPAAMGQSFFLAGYRIFVRFKPAPDATLRGLYILRSDTNRRLMAIAGNLLTHYQYRLSKVSAAREGDLLRCRIVTRQHAADLDVAADLAEEGRLPEGSPFASHHEARRFAGPLPFTFDHERETGSIIAIKGVRRNWNPRLVNLRVETPGFFSHGPLARLQPRLASAFYVENIDYQWNPGIRHRLPAGTARREDPASRRLAGLFERAF